METVREVLVKLKIQLDKTKIEFPDFKEAIAGAKQLETQYKAAADALDRASQAGMSAAAKSASKGQSAASIDPMLDARSAAIAKAAAEEKKLRQSAEKYDEQMAQRRQKAADQSRLAAEKELAEKNKFLAQAAAQAEKQLAADEKRMAKAEAAAKRHAANLAATASAGQSQPAAAVAAGQVAPSSAPAAEAAKGAINTSEAYTRAGDAFKSAGEGAFTLARGVVLLTSANEKDLAVMVQRLAVYQGSFDILKGSFEVGKGVAVATKSLAIAHASASVAAAIQAGSVGTLTIALIAAKGAALSFWAALTGPVGLAILGTAAALGAGYLLWNRYSGSAEAAAEKVKKAAEKEVEAARKRIEALRELSAAQLQANKLQAQFDFGAQVRGLTDANPAVSFLDKLRATQEASQADRAKSIAELTRGSNFAEGRKVEKGTMNDPSYVRDQVKSAGEYLDVMKRIRQENTARSVILRLGDNDRSILKLKTEEERTKAINEIHQKDTSALNAHVALYEKLSQANERQLSIGRERLKLLGDEETRLKGIKTAHDANAKAASDAKKALAAQNLSDVQKFANLSPIQQDQLRDISQRVGKAGGNLEAAGLQKHEIDLLRETGLSEANVQRYDLNRGMAAGAQDILKNLGAQNVSATEAALGKGQEGDDRSVMLDFMTQAADAGRKAINQEMAKLQAAKEKETEELTAALKELSNNRELIETIKEAIKARDEEIARLKVALDQQKNALDANEQGKRFRDLSGRDN